jgi:hypothetical protein
LKTGTTIDSPGAAACRALRPPDRVVFAGIMLLEPLFMADL